MCFAEHLFLNFNMMVDLMKRLACLLVLVMTSLVAHAQSDDVVIVIPEGWEGAVPIAVVPFAWQSTDPSDTTLTDVIGSDLRRSGQFQILPEQDLIERPHRISDVQFGTWRRLEVDYIVVGEIGGDSELGYTVEWWLVNVVTGETLLAQRNRTGDLRKGAHEIADRIFEKLLNVPGAFSTRIAYVTAEGAGDDRNYALMVADADGHNAQSMVRSRQPLLSPSWSPDGERVAYVSFEQGNSSIIVQEVATGSRRAIASFKGINGAPTFSPDGSRLALTLSRTGNPEIYVMDIASGRLKQLTNHWAIDTEPAWDVDGRSIYFTSDRGGKPQIYRVSTIGDDKPQRVTRRGEYNARVSVSPDGKRLAMVHGNNNDYRIAVLDLETDLVSVVSKGPLDESPSFAPNGSMLLYASRKGTQGVLSAVPVLGVTAGSQAAHQLVFAQGDIREPAWGPYRR